MHRSRLIISISVACILLLGLAYRAEADGSVSLSLSPPSGEFLVGETFTVTLLVNTGDTEIGSVEAALTYPPDILQVVSPLSGRSLITAWTQTPLVANFEGAVTFSGSIAPGIRTSGGTVLALELRAIAPGEARVGLREVRVTKAGEESAEIETRVADAVYRTILPPPLGPRVESPTHPDSLRWTPNTQPAFNWKTSEGNMFRYALDQQPHTIPDAAHETTLSSIELSVERDGVWYFHLAGRRTDLTWSGETHYALRVDKTPPTTPAITLERAEGKTRATFSSTDASSGVDRYEARIVPKEKPGLAQGFFATVSSPLSLENLGSGEYHLTVRAYDRAGNFSETEKDVSITHSRIPLSIPWRIAYAALAIAAVVSAALLWEVFRHHRNVRKNLVRSAERAEKKLEKDLAGLHPEEMQLGESARVKEAIAALHEAHRAMEGKDGAPPPPPAP